LIAKVRKAVSSLDSDGRWIKDDAMDCAEFVKHMNAMTNYVEARKKSGD